MTAKERAEALVKRLSYNGFEMKADTAIEIAGLVCYFIKEHTEEHEPYATRDISALDSALTSIDLFLED